MHQPPMHNRLPTGPGSRGGRWHDPEFRRLYKRAWRAAHPEYRDRERLRGMRKRRPFEEIDPAGIRASMIRSSFPHPAQPCMCPCGCHEPTDVYSFRLWFCAAMEASGLSSRRVARMAGIHHTTLSRLKSSDRTPLYSTATALVAVLSDYQEIVLVCGFCLEDIHDEPEEKD